MKELNFKEWLVSQDVDTNGFWNNCKKENQGWGFKIEYEKRKKLKNKSKYLWLSHSFMWDKTKQGFLYWAEIDRKWRKTIKEHESNNKPYKIEFGFGKDK